MFKVIVSDVECFGKLGYFTTRSVAFGKSPKQAWAKLRRRGEHTVSGGHPEGYGGVPVLQMRRRRMAKCCPRSGIDVSPLPVRV